MAEATATAHACPVIPIKLSKSRITRETPKDDVIISHRYRETPGRNLSLQLYVELRRYVSDLMNWAVRSLSNGT